MENRTKSDQEHSYVPLPYIPHSRLEYAVAQYHPVNSTQDVADFFIN